MSVEVVEGEEEEEEKEVEGRQSSSEERGFWLRVSNGIDSACGDDSVVESKKAPILGNNAIL